MPSLGGDTTCSTHPHKEFITVEYHPCDQTWVPQPPLQQKHSTSSPDLNPKPCSSVPLNSVLQMLSEYAVQHLNKWHVLNSHNPVQTVLTNGVTSPYHNVHHTTNHSHCGCSLGQWSIRYARVSSLFRQVMAVNSTGSISNRMHFYYTYTQQRQLAPHTHTRTSSQRFQEEYHSPDLLWATQGHHNLPRQEKRSTSWSKPYTKKTLSSLNSVIHTLTKYVVQPTFEQMGHAQFSQPKSNCFCLIISHVPSYCTSQTSHSWTTALVDALCD